MDCPDCRASFEGLWPYLFHVCPVPQATRAERRRRRVKQAR